MNRRLGSVTVAALLGLLCAAVADGAVWYVDKDNASGVKDGTSWATAFTQIQPAIEAARAAGGGEVWVAEGVYAEARTSLVHVPRVDTGSIVMRSGVHLYGGFAGTETVRNDRDWTLHETELDGSKARAKEPAFHVLVGANNATLDGFVVRGGFAGIPPEEEPEKADPLPADAYNGAGLFIDGVSPRLENCTFAENEAQGSGGAVYSRNSTAQALNCRFEANRALEGGAVFSYASNLAITNCDFVENRTVAPEGTAAGAGLDGPWGGAIHNDRASASLTRCRFFRNASVANGGAIGVEGGNDGTQQSSVAIVECTFAQNTALSGGGMQIGRNAMASIARSSFLYNGAGTGGGLAAVANLNVPQPVRVADSVFWRNTAQASGGGVHGFNARVELAHCSFHLNRILDETVESGGAVYSYDAQGARGLKAVNCVFWGDTPLEAGFDQGFFEVTHSVIEGGFDGEGNIDVEPSFAAGGAGDLRLAARSAGVDSGVPDFSTADWLGVPRPQGGLADMGAYELPVPAPADADGDGIPDAVEVPGDSDNDGTPDGFEADSDGDGLPDAAEGIADVDADGAPNFTDTDSDGDGFDDAVEAALEMEVYGSDLPDADMDEDGLTVAEEVELGTRPYEADTDADGMPDGWEAEHALDPLSDVDAVRDADSDGVSNLEEYELETNPLDPQDPPKDVYVSPEGSDATGTGAIDNPWRTIARATSVYSAGRYSPVSPVTVNLAPGVYEEAVVLPPQMTLAGESPATTTVSHYRAADAEHVIVRGGEGAALRDLKVQVPGTPAAMVVLVQIDGVSMEVSNVVLDGNYSPFSVGLWIAGEGSNGSVVRDSTIRRVGDGAWVVQSAAVITRNAFVDILDDALFIRLPDAKQDDGLAPRLGDAGQVETTGLNRFRLVDGYCVWNGGTVEVPAENNDWGAYTAGEIAAKLRGTVDYAPFVGMPMGPGTVAVRLLDAGTGEAVPASSNPLAALADPAMTAALDGQSGLLLLNGIPAGFRVMSATADGYAVGVRAFTLAEGAVAGFDMPLLPAGASHPANVDRLGGVNALDVQLVINRALGIVVPLIDADISGDGRVNALDVQLVINAALGLF